MNDKLKLPINAEYTVSVENIKFRLLIAEQPSETAKGDNENSPLILHDHVSAEIFAAVKGSTKICCEGSDVFLEEGDVAIVPPGLRHTMLPLADCSDTAVLSFVCDKENTRGTSDLYSELSPFFRGDKIAVFRDMSDVCRKIKRISETMNYNESIIPAMEIVILLLEISKIRTCEPENSREAHEEQYDIKRMMLLDSIIGNYYLKDLKLSDVAEQLYISSRQLDRIVRKRYGKSLRKVIVEKRIKAAEEMILTTDMTVEKIGSSVGFSSNAGFYREFFAVHRMTPAEYKKIQKNTCKK